MEYGWHTDTQMDTQISLIAGNAVRQFVFVLYWEEQRGSDNGVYWGCDNITHLIGHEHPQAFWWGANHSTCSFNDNNKINAWSNNLRLCWLPSISRIVSECLIVTSSHFNPCAVLQTWSYLYTQHYIHAWNSCIPNEYLMYTWTCYQYMIEEDLFLCTVYRIRRWF